MINLMMIFLGGGLGALTRYTVGLSIGKPALEGKIPLAVLACNIIGCFLIGWFFVWQKETHPHWLPHLVVTGFLGGFTTFSSFGLESFRLYEAGSHLNLAIYFLTSTLGGFAALVLAMKLFKQPI